MAALVGLQEAKRGLNMSASQTNDDELGDVLAAAIEQVEAYVGPLSEREVVETHQSPGASIMLRQVPVLGVDSVAGLGGGSLPYGPGDLLVDSRTGILRPLSGDTFGSFDAPWGGVTVTYRAGRAADAVPESINRAIIIVTEHLWETQRGWATAPSWRGDQSAEPDATTRPMGFALPSRALQLLEPHMMVVVG